MTEPLRSRGALIESSKADRANAIYRYYYLFWGDAVGQLERPVPILLERRVERRGSAAGTAPASLRTGR